MIVRNDNKLHILRNYLYESGLEKESDYIRDLILKTSNENIHSLEKWQECLNELNEPDEKQFTSILGEYIIGVFTMQQKAAELNKHGGNLSESQAKSVVEDLANSGADYNTLQGLAQSTGGNKNSGIKKIGYIHNSNILPVGVAYHLMSNDKIEKIASADNYIMSPDFNPSDYELKLAIKNAYIDSKVFEVLNKSKPNYNSEDFYHARGFLSLCMDNPKFIKNSVIRTANSIDRGLIKQAGFWNNPLGTLGDAVSTVVEGVGDAITWTAEKVSVYGTRMINDITEHGMEFLSTLGTKFVSWAKNNPVIAAIIATASIVWFKVILTALPWLAAVYGFVMGTKNIYYGWKSVKQIAENEGAHQFGLNTTISAASDYFNPKNALKLHTKLEGLMGDDSNFIREFDESELPSGFSKEDFENPLIADPVIFKRFIRICKLSRVFIIEMLGAPFHFTLMCLDLLSIWLWGAKLGSLFTGLAAPLFLFIVFIIELAVNVAIIFVQHYVATDKRKEWDPLFSKLHNVVINNISRLLNKDADASEEEEALEIYYEEIDYIISSLNAQGRENEISTEIDKYIERERQSGIHVSQEIEDLLKSRARPSSVAKPNPRSLAQPISRPGNEINRATVP